MDLVLIVMALVAGGFAQEMYSASWRTWDRRDEYGFQLGFEAYHHAES
jgi:hypothetical protein